MKPGKSGLPRIIDATKYTIQGFKYVWKNEAAFREECMLVIVLFPIAIWLGENRIEQLLMIGAGFIVLITELLNSAIEAVVDRIGDGVHPLSGAAKDMGSAAVFTSLMLFIVVWVALLTN